MCRWVMVNGQVCKTQEELSLEMGCCIYEWDEPHGHPPNDGCLCPVDVPRMAEEVGMRCKRPESPDDNYDFSWFITSDPESRIKELRELSDSLEKECQELLSKRPRVKSFSECYERMKEIGPTGWDSEPDISRAIDELRGEVRMTDKEREVMTKLVEFWNAFCELQQPEGSNAQVRVQQAVHEIQGVMALRVARRVDPDLWR